MSGTSIDGVDLALCDIDDKGYNVLAADTVPYTEEWRQRLASLEHATALEYVKADVELGCLFGKIIRDFLFRINVQVDAIASHGHTIFHQPGIGITAQIGNADTIAAVAKLPVVSGFRTLDVALGGQGAPLVPIGDELFFGQYDACLNLGGIANISYRVDDKRIAYDICPCNMALNRLASKLGLDYDPEGQNARRGMLDHTLCDQLNRLEYYLNPPPKSLGKEWFVSEFWPVVEAARIDTIDALRTVSDHIAWQIGSVLRRQNIGSLLVTGGGAFNTYLIELLQKYAPKVDVTIPDELTIKYKEAIIFALLGYLRLERKYNTLASVTGACCDSIGGSVSGLVTPMVYEDTDDGDQNGTSHPLLHALLDIV